MKRDSRFVWHAFISTAREKIKSPGFDTMQKADDWAENFIKNSRDKTTGVTIAPAAHMRGQMRSYKLHKNPARKRRAKRAKKTIRVRKIKRNPRLRKARSHAESRKWRGVVGAGNGLLLGGVKIHNSIWFASKKDAKDWTYSIVKGNQEAKRDVSFAFVEDNRPMGKLKSEFKRRDEKSMRYYH